MYPLGIHNYNELQALVGWAPLEKVEDFRMYEFCTEILRRDKEGVDNIKVRTCAAYLAKCQGRLADLEPKDNAHFESTSRQAPEEN